MRRSFTHRKSTGDHPWRVVITRRSAIAACSTAMLLTAGIPGPGKLAGASEIVVLRSSPNRHILYTSAVPPGRFATAVVGYQPPIPIWRWEYPPGRWVPVYDSSAYAAQNVAPQAPASFAPKNASENYAYDEGGATSGGGL